MRGREAGHAQTTGCSIRSGPFGSVDINPDSSTILGRRYLARKAEQLGKIVNQPKSQVNQTSVRNLMQHLVCGSNVCREDDRDDVEKQSLWLELLLDTSLSDVRVPKSSSSSSPLSPNSSASFSSSSSSSS